MGWIGQRLRHRAKAPGQKGAGALAPARKKQPRGPAFASVIAFLRRAVHAGRNQPKQRFGCLGRLAFQEIREQKTQVEGLQPIRAKSRLVLGPDAKIIGVAFRSRFVSRLDPQGLKAESAARIADGVARRRGAGGQQPSAAGGVLLQPPRFGVAQVLQIGQNDQRIVLERLGRLARRERGQLGGVENEMPLRQQPEQAFVFGIAGLDQADVGLGHGGVEPGLMRGVELKNGAGAADSRAVLLAFERADDIEIEPSAVGHVLRQAQPRQMLRDRRMPEGNIHEVHGGVGDSLAAIRAQRAFHIVAGRVVPFGQRAVHRRVRFAADHIDAFGRIGADR
ncbi:MAG: hypothetical protein BWZ10_03285 [candidate division BRC1 bacterium ADurb.BinA364]|nr:MAG: hypothetical protein BWZ10_03285 [candidate division BRC1 bacterium ADurb.BinA364]